MTRREQEIEAVAQAIRSAWIGDNRVRGKEWLEIPERQRDQFRKEAAAAIAALENTRGAK